MFSSKNTFDDVVSKYHKHIVGVPVMVPQWTFGWHQCKWGYKDTNDLRYVVGNYSKYDLPLDTQWVDIDWMQDYKNF
jgi:alpha-glucosidase (family GH31 glycosyl hydrolase)